MEREATTPTGFRGCCRLPTVALLLACEACAGDQGDWGDMDVLGIPAGEGWGPAPGLEGWTVQPSGRWLHAHLHNRVLVPDDEWVHLLFHHNYARAYSSTSTDRGVHWDAPWESLRRTGRIPLCGMPAPPRPGHGIQTRSERLAAPAWLAVGAVCADGISQEHWPSVAGYIYFTAMPAA